LFCYDLDWDLLLTPAYPTFSWLIQRFIELPEPLPEKISCFHPQSRNMLTLKMIDYGAYD